MTALLTKTLKYMIGIVWAVALTGFLNPVAAADAVKLRLGWTFGGIFAPLYLGVDKGFFTEQGINLEILEGKGTVASATPVANGSDDFGYFDMSAVARLVDKGLPLKGIAQIRQKSTMGVLTLASSGITKPKDLEGRTLAYTPGDSLSAIFPAFAKAAELDTSKIKMQGLDFSVYLKALTGGQVDALLSYRDVAGFALENQGIPIVHLAYADAGVRIVDYGFVTSTAMIKDKPDLVRRFVAGALKSIKYASEHIDETVAFGKKKFPEYNEALLKKESSFQSSLFGDSVKAGKPIGWVDDAAWKETLAILKGSVGLSDTDTSRYYTNDFIPAAN